MISIIAIERRHIESSREARLPLLEQIFEASIGIFSSAKSSEHAHRPRLSTIHRGLDRSCVGILSRQSEVTTIIQCHIILRSVDAIDRDTGGCHQISAFGDAFQRFFDGRFFPLYTLNREAL